MAQASLPQQSSPTLTSHTPHTTPQQSLATEPQDHQHSSVEDQHHSTAAQSISEASGQTQQGNTTAECHLPASTASGHNHLAGSVTSGNADADKTVQRVPSTIPNGNADAANTNHTPRPTARISARPSSHESAGDAVSFTPATAFDRADTTCPDQNAPAPDPVSPAHNATATASERADPIGPGLSTLAAGPRTTNRVCHGLNATATASRRADQTGPGQYAPAPATDPVCPACLGVLQSPERGLQAVPAAMLAGLPEAEGNAGRWLTCTSASPASLAHCVRYAVHHK